MMRDYFYELSDHATGLIRSDEVALLNIEGEASDFIRLNNMKIRQAGRVNQSYLDLTLIKGQKKTSHSFTLFYEPETDKAQIRSALETVRSRIDYLTDDPYLAYAREVDNTENITENELPEPEQALQEIRSAANGTDLVGIYAGGFIYRGFANSLGQKNWHENHSFNFDFSLYYQTDKAVKSGYAGFKWDGDRFQQVMDQAASQLEMMKRSPVNITPGTYRVYLAPKAVSVLVNVLNWKGFGARHRHSKTSSLNRMIYDGQRLSPEITVRENTRDGIACRFQADGFIKPDMVPLIEKGAIGDPLVSARSAVEYGLACNGASPAETAESLEIFGGSLASSDILASLDSGIYLNNLHYLNYSDVNAARITGMTRFAAFRVEKGEIKSPINVMRFDETIYNIFGTNLIALTRKRDLILSSATYGNRNTESKLLPGAIVNDFRFTL